jgi:N-acetylmuramoyl-L-alanine amidase
VPQRQTQSRKQTTSPALAKDPVTDTYRKVGVRRPTLLYLQRFFALISFTLLLWLLLIVAGFFGYDISFGMEQWSISRIMPAGLRPPLWNHDIAIISGHAGHDSGAVCTDASGQVTITEAGINQEIAQLLVQRLSDLGASVLLLEEYDPQLNGLRSKLLLSLHADSCISASGFKAATYTQSRIPVTEARLLACINHHYAEGTGLAQHPNTVTHDMTEYHAFRRIHHETPAAILEMGFMGGDQSLLTQEQARVAEAITDAILCFLQPEALQPQDEQNEPE